MVRIEIKKTVKGQMMLAMEAEHEELEEVLMCAARFLWERPGNCAARFLPARNLPMKRQG